MKRCFPNDVCHVVSDILTLPKPRPPRPRSGGVANSVPGAPAGAVAPGRWGRAGGGRPGRWPADSVRSGPRSYISGSNWRGRTLMIVGAFQLRPGELEALEVLTQGLTMPPDGVGAVAHGHLEFL